MTSTVEPRFTLAVSYASADRDYVEAVVNALKGRGVSVFYAPDDQADIIGRNLIDYLHDVYLTQARLPSLHLQVVHIEQVDKPGRTTSNARASTRRRRPIHHPCAA